MKFATFERNGQRRVGLVGPDADAICPIDAANLVELIARFDARCESEAKRDRMLRSRQ